MNRALENNLGTPQTLEAACKLAICTARGPESAKYVRQVIADFLAQKFQRAILINEQFESELMELFNECTRGDK